jgi:hypothetical protein
MIFLGNIQKPVKYTLFADDYNIHYSGIDTGSTTVHSKNAINNGLRILASNSHHAKHNA